MGFGFGGNFGGGSSPVGFGGRFGASVRRPGMDQGQDPQRAMDQGQSAIQGSGIVQDSQSVQQGGAPPETVQNSRRFTFGGGSPMPHVQRSGGGMQFGMGSGEGGGRPLQFAGRFGPVQFGLGMERGGFRGFGGFGAGGRMRQMQDAQGVPNAPIPPASPASAPASAPAAPSYLGPFSGLPEDQDLYARNAAAAGSYGGMMGS